MAGIRLPGPLNLLNLDGLSGVMQLRLGDSPAPVGASPDSAQPATASPEIARRTRERAESVTYREIMSGLHSGVFDLDTGVPMDANRFNWRVPFRTRGGIFIMEPRRIDSSMRIVRDQIVDLLNSSLLPNHISGMLRRTRTARAEHKAYILADGNIGGMIYGQRHHVGNMDIPDGVGPIAVVHTHPPSTVLAPPSFPADFRRDMLQLVAEYAQGRLWIAAWPNLALLLGQIVVGVGNDRHAHFRPIVRTDPRCDNVFHMSSYVPTFVGAPLP